MWTFEGKGEGLNKIVREVGKGTIRPESLWIAPYSFADEMKS